MSQDNDNVFDAMVREFVIAESAWPQTDEEIDAVLEGEDECDPYTESERIAHVRAILEACGEEPIHAQGEQLELFDSSTCASNDTYCRHRDLFDIVRLAYRDVHDGWSSDRLVADPDMDARFIQACWRLGAQASQFELNHLLINARKRKIIGKTEGVKRYHVDSAVMDQYWLASEFAARIIQDREFLDHHRRITVDHILCDPRLAAEFDELAMNVSPGFSSLDYRWAALAIRKARSRAQGLGIAKDEFEWIGRLDSIRPSQIADVDGFLWVRRADAHIYIGHGESLRAHAERIMQAQIDRIMSLLPLFQCESKEPLVLGIAERPRCRALSRQPNNLVRGLKPCLNVLAGSSLNLAGRSSADGEERRACGAA